MELPDQDTYVCHTQVAEYKWLAVVTGKARARDNNFHESSHCWNLRYSNSYSYKLDVFRRRKTSTLSGKRRNLLRSCPWMGKKFGVR